MEQTARTVSRRLAISMVVLAVAMGLLVPAGCSSTALRCQYQLGDMEKICYSSGSTNKVWVEMPGKKPTKPQLNVRKKEIVMRREVESLDNNGTALMKITIEKAIVSVHVDVNKKKSDKKYISTTEETTSNFTAPEPAIAGVTYKIKIAPDTTVTEVIGLQDARKKLNLNKDATGIVAALLKEDFIKTCHQCDFVRFNTDGVSAGKSYNKVVETPSEMIKAKAIKKIYTVSELNDQKVSIENSCEPIHVLPQGLEEPETPANPYQIMIRDNSVMDILTVSGQNSFNTATGKVAKADESLVCELILDGDKLGFGEKGKNKKKGSGGKMFTSIKKYSTYEIVD